MGGRLQNKVCVVTGSGGGIGAGVARRFAEEGAVVYLLDYNEEKLSATVGAFKNLGLDAEGILTDVGEEKQIKEAFAIVAGKHGRLDVLHTNTWWAAKKKAADLTLEEWNKALSITLTAPFLCSKYAIPLMSASGGGSIIHTSSVGGVVAFREHADYISAKAGVIQLCKSIAVDYGSERIRCNAVCPGIIDTPQTRSDLEDPDYSNYLMSKCLNGRIGQPEDVAAASLFLASDEASFITGSVLMVDDGWSII
ncbi:SDR family NAD(P)-dependent oxidoreductase [Cohnella faecalis]|uniref:SDR family oxidoreductase n=1 Tax=Cohnella faecalis TaxID=2315694 RepID=A0A398CH11_9BACL|nr:SDR family oxidoreductase [Cohnella faecalis]RIE00369.1 SDR family oxidoreductase [Cohnella faecalis]